MAQWVKPENRKHPLFEEDVERVWQGPYCFIQAADTQFGMIESYLEKKENPKWDKEIALTRKAIEKANSMQPKPRFFVVCGDMLDAFPEKNPEMRDEQLRDFKKVFAEMDPDIPLVCVCGNHDIGNTPTADTIAKYHTDFGDDYFTFWCGGVFFLVINTQYYEDPSQVKTLAEEHNKWLDEQLEKVKQSGKHCVIFQHIPWFLVNPNEAKEYFNMEMPLRRIMLDKFKAAGVRYIFTGHYHRNAGGRDGQLEEVVTSAIGAQLGNDTHGFRVVKVTEDKLEHQYYPLDDVPANITF